MTLADDFRREAITYKGAHARVPLDEWERLLARVEKMEAALEGWPLKLIYETVCDCRAEALAALDREEAES